AEYVGAGDLAAMAGCHHRLAKGVERAGADVAIDDAETAQRQRPKADAFGRSVRGGRGRCCRSFRRDVHHLTFLIGRESSYRSRKRPYSTRAHAATRRRPCEDYVDIRGRAARRRAKRRGGPGQGLKSGGSGGSPRISVMVTRRFAAMNGSSE